MSRLKEIEEMMADYAKPNSTTDGGNLYSEMPWLINRVKRLTEALDFIADYCVSHEDPDLDICVEKARKALEDDSE